MTDVYNQQYTTNQNIYSTPSTIGSITTGNTVPVDTSTSVFGSGSLSWP